jgi:hypothetical protein
MRIIFITLLFIFHLPTQCYSQDCMVDFERQCGPTYPYPCDQAGCVFPVDDPASCSYAEGNYVDFELTYEDWRLANSGEQGRAGNWVGTPVNCGYKIACTCDEFSTFYCKPIGDPLVDYVYANYEPSGLSSTCVGL